MLQACRAATTWLPNPSNVPGLWGLMLWLALGTGCGPTGAGPAAGNAAGGSTGTVKHELRTVGRSVEGRAIEAHVVGGGSGALPESRANDGEKRNSESGEDGTSGGGGGGGEADVTLYLASIHGSEPAGTPLAHRLVRHLRAHPRLLEGKRAVVVPVANPDGLAASRRTNANGVDLNRNFPADNRRNGKRFGARGLSEPEARAIAVLIDVHRPDRIITIHQPLSCVDYDGPGQALAERIAGACELEVRKLGARPGSLGSYAGVDRGIPIVTLELPRDAHQRSDAELWTAYGAALLAGMGVEPD